MKIKPKVRFQSLNTIPGFKIQQAVPCKCAHRLPLQGIKNTHKPHTHTHDFLFIFTLKKKKKITEGAYKQTSCYNL